MFQGQVCSLAKRHKDKFTRCLVREGCQTGSPAPNYFSVSVCARDQQFCLMSKHLSSKLVGTDLT